MEDNKDMIALLKEFPVTFDDEQGAGNPVDLPVASDDKISKEDLLIKSFDKELAEWDVIIKSLSTRMRDITKCVDVQGDGYDYRHKIVDKKHKLLRTLSKYNKKYKEDYNKRLNHYATNYDRKLTAAEREKMVLGDMAAYKYRVDLLENHINHIDQTFKSIENMIFGLKYRLELEDYLRKL